MIRLPLILLLFLFLQKLEAQEKKSQPVLLAEKQIGILRGGTLVVRLKTNEKSINAYRTNGNEKMAKQLENQYRLMNLYTVRGFLNNFNFCRLLFIKSKDTEKLQNSEPYIFLNEKLEVDSTITFWGLKNPFSYDSFFIAEYGTLVSNETTNSYNYNLGQTRESSNAASTSALVIMDATATQLKNPFPFFATVPTFSFKATVKQFDIDAKDSARTEKRNRKYKGKNIPPREIKTVYDVGVETLNGRLVRYYTSVAIADSTFKEQTIGWWFEQNPNKNIDKRVELLDKEIVKAIREGKAISHLPSDD